MNIAAIAWAWSQDVGKSPRKVVLLAMTWLAEGDEMLCAAGYESLSKLTLLDPKTVNQAMDRLRESGHITATELRAGATNKIVVHRVNAPKNGVIQTGPEGEGGDKLQHANAPKSGAIKPELNDTVFSGNPPKFPVESPQISGRIPPNSGELISLSSSSIEQPKKTKRVKGKGSGEGDASKPGDVTEQTWLSWTSLRRKKRATVDDTVIDFARSEAAKADLTLEGFLKVWCFRGSQGLQADWLKPAERGTTKQISRHSGFRSIDYEEGLTNGTPDA